jgi:hypothetical protein
VLVPKSNNANTIAKFYEQDVELVKKLNFYNPSIFKSHKTKDNKDVLDFEIDNNLFSMKTNSLKLSVRRNASMPDMNEFAELRGQRRSGTEIHSKFNPSPDSSVLKSNHLI